MTPPKVSYIVSAYDRPKALRCCLASLDAQSAFDFEVIVADNGGLEEHRRIVDAFDWRFRYVDTSKATKVCDCYWSAEWAVEHEAKGEWLCFPSDDSYYVPVYQVTMLYAAELHGWDLVYCDMLYDRRIGGRYDVLNVQPRIDHIDKTGFLLRRTRFFGFPTKPDYPRPSSADCEMIDRYVHMDKRRNSFGKVNEVLVVHN